MQRKHQGSSFKQGFTHQSWKEAQQYHRSKHSSFGSTICESLWSSRDGDARCCFPSTRTPAQTRPWSLYILSEMSDVRRGQYRWFHLPSQQCDSLGNVLSNTTRFSIRYHDPWVLSSSVLWHCVRWFQCFRTKEKYFYPIVNFVPTHGKCRKLKLFCVAAVEDDATVNRAARCHEWYQDDIHVREKAIVMRSFLCRYEEQI